MRLFVVFISFPLVLLTGCSSMGPEFDPEIEPGVFRFDFETGEQGWTPLFTGIPTNKPDGEDLDGDPEIEYDHRILPEGLQTDEQALFIRAFTGSSGLGMFFKRPVEGLTPGATYQVGFEVEMATNTPSGCLGPGGGSKATRVITAALSFEPERTLEEGRHVNWYEMEQRFEEALEFPFGLTDPPVLGAPDNDIPCGEAQEQGKPWRLKRLEGGSGFWQVTADAEGRAWLLIGTWTTGLGPKDFYYNEITVRFEEQ